MGLFRPYQRDEAGSGEKPATDRSKLVLSRKTKPQKPKSTASPKPAQPNEPKSKSRFKEGPTLTRKQAEQARMERLHPDLNPKEARKREREARRARRMELWEKAESGPARTLLRNYVDSRWTTTEFMLPVIILMMAGTMIASRSAVWTFGLAVALWVFILVWIVNMVILWRGFKRELHERYPGEPTRGLLMYLINRSMMIRRFRSPRTVIDRGEDY